MTWRSRLEASGKISPRFAERLARLGPQAPVRAFVLLRISWPDGAPPSRAHRRRREVARQAVRSSAARALPEIDQILERHGGRRLTSEPDATGSVPVETSVRGIGALAACEEVGAIMEDQPISLIQ